jgi:hypothetical protein
MLAYNLDDYGTNFSNDIYSEADAPNKLIGYACFYK